MAKSGVAPGPSVKAKAGDIVVFRTRVPGGTSSHLVKVKLSIMQGARGSLVATASTKHEKSTATVSSSDGKLLTLVEPRYTCALPPMPSFCPARNASSTGKGVTAEFMAKATTPIVIVTMVGPTNVTVPTASTGTLVVPAYTVTQSVEARSPTAGASASSAPSSSASAKAGDLVLMRTHLTGAHNGAPQPLTVSFDQGPAGALRVTAGVPGGAPSTATLTGAGGKQIALVSPRYTCYLPPTPTFCPASKVVAKSRNYAVTFPATPHTQVSIEALAQAG